VDRELIGIVSALVIICLAAAARMGCATNLHDSVVRKGPRLIDRANMAAPRHEPGNLNGIANRLLVH
jgi:hypothetical protein